MLKLYKRIGPNEIHYSEAWVDGDEVVEHWGAVGNRGASRRHPLDPLLNPEKNLERILAAVQGQGFASVPIEDHKTLMVEYLVEGMGTGGDLKKRHQLQERLDDLLGWTGAGHCDGGSIGSGTMEACCYVVDFNIAKSVVEKGLAHTEFSDYLRIYEEAE